MAIFSRLTKAIELETADFEQISGMRINDRQLLVFDPFRQSSEGLIEFEYYASFEEKKHEQWLLYECKLLNHRKGIQIRNKDKLSL